MNPGGGHPRGGFGQNPNFRRPSAVSDAFSDSESGLMKPYMPPNNRPRGISDPSSSDDTDSVHDLPPQYVPPPPPSVQQYGRFSPSDNRTISQDTSYSIQEERQSRQPSADDWLRKDPMTYVVGKRDNVLLDPSTVTALASKVRPQHRRKRSSSYSSSRSSNMSGGMYPDDLLDRRSQSPVQPVDDRSWNRYSPDPPMSAPIPSRDTEYLVYQNPEEMMPSVMADEQGMVYDVFDDEEEADLEDSDDNDEFLQLYDDYDIYEEYGGGDAKDEGERVYIEPPTIVNNNVHTLEPESLEQEDATFEISDYANLDDVEQVAIREPEEVQPERYTPSHPIDMSRTKQPHQLPRRTSSAFHHFSPPSHDPAGFRAPQLHEIEQAVAKSSVPTPAANVESVIPARGSSHVISQHLARGNTITSRTPDRTVITAAREAAKQLGTGENQQQHQQQQPQQHHQQNLQPIQQQQQFQISPSHSPSSSPPTSGIKVPRRSESISRATAELYVRTLATNQNQNPPSPGVAGYPRFPSDPSSARQPGEGTLRRAYTTANTYPPPPPSPLAPSDASFHYAGPPTIPPQSQRDNFQQQLQPPQINPQTAPSPSRSPAPASPRLTPQRPTGPSPPPQSRNEATIHQIDSLLDVGARYLCTGNGNVQTSSQGTSTLDYDQAISTWQEAADLAATVGDKFREAKALNNMACAWRRIGLDEAALGSLDKAWGLARMELEALLIGSGWDRALLDLSVVLVEEGHGEDEGEDEVGFGERRRSVKQVRRLLQLAGLGKKKPDLNVNVNVGAAGAGAGVGGLSRENTLMRGPSGWLSSNSGIGAPNSVSNSGTIRRRVTSVGRVPTGETGGPARSLKNPHVELSPPLLVLLMDLCTSYGNAFFSTGKTAEALFWHQTCLDLAQETLLTFPLPLKAAEAMAAEGIPSMAGLRSVPLKLSYLHQNTLIARCRSFSHLGLCLQRMGEPHRSVKFQQRALASLDVAGPQTHLIAPAAHAAVIGNLAAAQFDVGRLVEAVKGLADSARKFAGIATDRSGLVRAQTNVAACWIEIGRLGATVAVVVGETFKDTSHHLGHASPVVVPQRKGSIAQMINDGNRNLHSQPPGFETLRRAMSVSSPQAPPSLGSGSSSGSGSGNSLRQPLRQMQISQARDILQNSSPVGSPLTTGNPIPIPPRLHSVPMSKDTSVTGVRALKDEAIAAAVHKARKEGPTWFSDILSALRILQVALDEALELREVEVSGIIRFNLAAAFILLRLPVHAAKILFEAPFNWNDIMSNKPAFNKSSSFRTPSPADSLNTGSTTNSNLWDYGAEATCMSRCLERPSALFNLTQLLFVLSNETSFSSRPHADITGGLDVESLPASDIAAIESLIKIVLRAVGKESLADIMSPTTTIQALMSQGGNPQQQLQPASFNPAQPSDSNKSPIHVDPDVLISALKRCLEWFDGSSLGPSAGGGSKAGIPQQRDLQRSGTIQSPVSPSGSGAGGQTGRPGLLLPDAKQAADSAGVPETYGKPPAMTPAGTNVGVNRTGTTTGGSSFGIIAPPAARKPSNTALPTVPRPRGSTTGATTRVCLALSRSLVTVFAGGPNVRRTATGAIQMPARRVAMAREEARRWCGVEASAGLGVAAAASVTSQVVMGGEGDMINDDQVTPRDRKRRSAKARSMVVNGSGLEGLLISAVAETGEVHGTLAMEVGAVAWELERLSSFKWDMNRLVEASDIIRQSGKTNEDEGTVSRLVKLAARRVKNEVVRAARVEEVSLEGSLEKIWRPAKSDDRKIHRWSGDGEYLEPVQSAIFETPASKTNASTTGAGSAAAPPPVYITKFDWIPIPPGKGQTVADLYAAGGTDGKFYLCSKAGRVEKVVEAHKGALLALKWNYEGSALLTAGEDGNLKIWSRTGMLRSSLVATGYPVYSIAWSPGNDNILYTNGRNLVIKPLQPSNKPTQWKAHDGVILAVDWNLVNNMIISGGEDRRYKVWDSYGRPMFSSTPHDHPITSLAWNPSGEMFVLGSFNMLRICDKLGWSYAVAKTDSGSIYGIAWTPDGTQVACAGGSGRLEWKNWEVTLLDDHKIDVHDVVQGANEHLEFRDRVIKASLGFNHLVVATYTQCYVYSDKNWNTPTIVDLSSNGRVLCIKQCQDFFVLVDNYTGMQIFTYEGRTVSSPKYPGMRPEMITSQLISISNDTLIVRDQTDEKSIYAFEVQSGRMIGEGPIKTPSEVVEIGINQVVGPFSSRQMVVVDKNRELFLSRVLKPTWKKLGTMVDTFAWNEETDMIGAMVDGKFMVWFYPNVVFIDDELEDLTRFEKDANQFGKNCQFVNFNGTQCTIRRADGALVTVNNISPFPALLQDMVKKKQWEQAIRMCRYAKAKELWSCLAAMGVAGQDLNTAEVSYAAIEAVQKVKYICYIRDIPSQEGRSAELALLRRQPKEAEAILVGAGLTYRCIRMWITLFNWERALEIAVKNKTHIDTVLYFREKYLKKTNRKETIKQFVQQSQGVTLEWDKIKAKIAAEEEKEKSKPSPARSSPTKQQPKV
ncbi:Intraflagellar transport protein 80 [Blyttiomyces sp. JEL0837]|nr:Intraflagellar transport protein 80 [Blyttiomyces sp. JEL0837]